jgi:hypothetical protein
VGVACGLLRDPETALLLNASTLRDTERRIKELQARSVARRHCCSVAFSLLTAARTCSGACARAPEAGGGRHGGQHARCAP